MQRKHVVRGDAWGREIETAKGLSPGDVLLRAPIAGLVAGTPVSSGREPDAMLLTRIPVRQPVLTAMMMIALLGFGSVSLLRINVDLYPEFDFPSSW